MNCVEWLLGNGTFQAQQTFAVTYKANNGGSFREVE
jgi:hypothetical protein